VCSALLASFFSESLDLGWDVLTGICLQLKFIVLYAILRYVLLEVETQSDSLLGFVALGINSGARNNWIPGP
jgi:hypothetical protein